ncbi:recombinase family protein [Nocardioides soli]|uniref:DNA invertase Pin-like site-specific DNA recombinase n=1 Tax=Nocardioides soli TaxID=1036020 RepID=A0A7W4VZW8_9ACTN|nr:recombinase family protein [Nocardioides soli]MBB3044891.1 DNA invertase Pin-like site-specific DNA recombinase [Nocardioides soli]
MGVTRAYRRISLDTAKSGSIAKQTERISAAEVVAGREVDAIEWYADESVSGSKVPFAGRPDGARLMADLGSGDRVVVTKIDRAARNVLDLLNIVKQIEAAGATVHFVDDKIDTEGPMGRFILTIIAAIAELEAGIIAERRRDSLESFKTQGRHAVGKAPFGFKSVGNPDGRGLVIVLDPDAAPRLREAIGRVMDGESQNAVRQSIGMSKTGFHKLLHNPRLAGMTPDGEGVVTVDGIPRIDPNAALLSMSEWRALRDFLGEPDKKWSRTDGIGAALSCKVCGGRLYKNVSKSKNKTTGRTHDTYVCRKAKHAPGENAPSIICHRADEYVESKFLGLFGDRRAMLAAVVDEDAARLEAVSAAQVRLQEAQRRFAAAATETDEEEALTALREAKRALGKAEQMPARRTTKIEDSGRTVAEVWADADSNERVRLLTRAGRWVLDFGRGSAESRISLEPDDLLTELLTREVGSYIDVGGLMI